jgi:hypothetical protein
MAINSDFGLPIGQHGSSSPRKLLNYDTDHSVGRQLDIMTIMTAIAPGVFSRAIPFCGRLWGKLDLVSRSSLGIGRIKSWGCLCEVPMCTSHAWARRHRVEEARSVRRISALIHDLNGLNYCIRGYLRASNLIRTGYNEQIMPP